MSSPFFLSYVEERSDAIHTEDIWCTIFAIISTQGPIHGPFIYFIAALSILWFLYFAFPPTTLLCGTRVQIFGFWHRRRDGRHFFRPSDCSFHLSTHCYRSVQDLNTVVAVFSLTHQPDMLLGQEPEKSVAEVVFFVEELALTLTRPRRKTTLRNKSS